MRLLLWYHDGERSGRCAAYPGRKGVCTVDRCRPHRYRSGLAVPARRGPASASRRRPLPALPTPTSRAPIPANCCPMPLHHLHRGQLPHRRLREPRCTTEYPRRCPVARGATSTTTSAWRNSTALSNFTRPTYRSRCGPCRTSIRGRPWNAPWRKGPVSAGLEKQLHLRARARSWVFLGEIVTNVELVPDTPQGKSCGTCAVYRRLPDGCDHRTVPHRSESLPVVYHPNARGDPG